MYAIKDSLWWRDLLSIGSNYVADMNWFANSIACKLRDGNNIIFWRNKWFDIYPMRELFQKLYFIS